MIKDNVKCRVFLSLMFAGLCLTAFSQPGSTPGQRPRLFEGIRNRFRPGGKNPQNQNQSQNQRQPGNLSHDEIVRAVRDRLSQLEQQNPELLADIMNRFDGDHNGEIDDQECIKIHEEHKKRQMQGNQHHPSPPDHMGLLDGVEIEGFVPPPRMPPMPPQGEF